MRGSAAGVTGVVLAGGRSSRMGRDKALLPLGGGRVVDAVVRALREAGCSPVLLAGPAEGYAGLGLTALPDPVPGLGPLSGIASGLRAAPTAYAFFAACDMPLLRPSMVRLLARLAAGWDGAVPAVGPGGWQPLCAVYGVSLLPLVEAAIEAPSGSRSLVDLLRRARVRPVREAELRAADPELASFVNVNTPAEYARVRARWARRDAPPPASPAGGRR